MHPQLADKYHNLVNYTDEIINSLRSIDPVILQHKPDAAVWSPIQVLDHLATAERLSNSYLIKKFPAIATLPNVGIKERALLLALGIAQRSFIRFKAPKYVSQPNGDLSLDEVTKMWKEEQKKLKLFLEAYPNEYLNRAIYRHPAIGRISIIQMIQSHVMHIKRHHKQIKGRIANFRHH